jgi:hypothetical protein
MFKAHEPRPVPALLNCPAELSPGSACCFAMAGYCDCIDHPQFGTPMRLRAKGNWQGRGVEFEIAGAANAALPGADYKQETNFPLPQ